MSKLSSKFVPPEIPKEPYKLLIIGESPGDQENRFGRPFVSWKVAKEYGINLDKQTAGEILDRYLGRNGLSRDQVGIMNLCNYQPLYNKFEACLGTPQLEEGLSMIEEEVKRSKPNCILALGGWPMYYLTGLATKEKGKITPGAGIMTYRGSRVPSTDRFLNTKVLCSLHPAYILRVWGMNPVFNVDILHAIEDSEFPELRLPEYEEFINPNTSTCQALVEEALQAFWLSVDIETFPGGRYSCVGFAWKDEEYGKMKSLCITYKAPYLTHFAKTLWESSVPKIFQYGTYDISFMRNFYDWKIGGYYDNHGWDTFVASASILPDFPRKLDFLTSLYTRFPYYKDERKVWREVGDMMTLWKYNIKDCVATYQIAMKQMEEIKELFPMRRVG